MKTFKEYCAAKGCEKLKITKPIRSKLIPGDNSKENEKEFDRPTKNRIK